MKYFLRILLLLLSPSFLMAQNAMYEEPTKKQADSLRIEFQILKNDTIRINICKKLGLYYQETNIDSSIYFHNHELRLAKQLNQKLWEALALDELGYAMYNIGNYAQSLNYLLQALNIAEDKECEKNVIEITEFSKDGNPHYARLYVLASVYDNLGILYRAAGNIQKAKSNYYKSLEVGEEVNDPIILTLANMDLGNLNLQLNNTDSALFFVKQALKYANGLGYMKYKGLIYIAAAEIFAKEGIQDSAKVYYNLAIRESKKNSNNIMTLAEVCLSVAKSFNTLEQPDSAVFYAVKSLKILQQLQSIRHLPEVYSTLASSYQMTSKPDSAYLFLQRAMNAQDSLANADKIKQFENIGFEEQLKIRELQNAEEELNNRIRTNTLLGSTFTLIVIAFFLYRNNRNKQKAKQKIELAYDKLKATQSQLIQSEKMASLGELTAGIAHEIQNPLNFVNNFSEVSEELIDEMNVELDKGDTNEVKAISDDLKQNLQKIHHHGQRASGIVKGMLEHSRTGDGVKEPTDINVLADEYLRLAYHGLRAKDKSFNSDFKTEFDESLPKINVISQDIGRVLLNLINNAFYAVDKKAKGGEEDYKPEVIVSTKKLDKSIEISVKDNGSGIPKEIKDKIFQPFFTTKPTGQGTGLGLSLSYDIITQGHDGHLEVETEEGVGTRFIIEIPLTT